MDYIVFDLEWNQCPYGKNRENPQLPFEIIEIGAVKMNGRKEVVDEYHQYIKPEVYDRLNFHTREILGISMRELEDGIPFPQAVRDFLKWCGDRPIFCTWGALDLNELQKNMKFYDIMDLLPGPIYYYDIQKLFAIAYENKEDRKSLGYAVEYLGIPEDGAFHEALEDARYTAKVLKRIPDLVIRTNCSVDSYQNPKTREEEIHILYSDYEKYISREFDTKEKAMEDKEVLSLRCCYCHKTARRKIKWFSTNTKIHIALGYCPKHGYMMGKIRMKKAESGKFYVIKTVREVEESEAVFIKDKQLELRKKRQLKRIRKRKEL